MSQLVCRRGEVSKPVWVMYAMVAGAYVISVAWATRHLPFHAATHFGPDGRADGWMTPASNLAVSAVMGAVVFILIPAIGWLASAGKATFVNLPTAAMKRYWTAPEHIEEFRGRIRSAMLIFAGLTGCLLVLAEMSIVAANRLNPPRLPGWASLGLWAFVALTIAWIGWLVWTLRLPRDA